MGYRQRPAKPPQRPGDVIPHRRRRTPHHGSRLSQRELVTVHEDHRCALTHRKLRQRTHQPGLEHHRVGPPAGLDPHHGSRAPPTTDLPTRRALADSVQIPARIRDPLHPPPVAPRPHQRIDRGLTTNLRSVARHQSPPQTRLHHGDELLEVIGHRHALRSDRIRLGHRLLHYPIEPQPPPIAPHPIEPVAQDNVGSRDGNQHSTRSPFTFEGRINPGQSINNRAAISYTVDRTIPLEGLQATRPKVVGDAALGVPPRLVVLPFRIDDTSDGNDRNDVGARVPEGGRSALGPCSGCERVGDEKHWIVIEATGSAVAVFVGEIVVEGRRATFE